MSMCSYVYALVQPNKHTHLQKHTHTHAHMLSQDVSQNPYPVPVFSAEPSNLGVKPLPVHLPGLDKQSTQRPRKATLAPTHPHPLRYSGSRRLHPRSRSLSAKHRPVSPMHKTRQPTFFKPLMLYRYICKRLLLTASRLICGGMLKGTSFTRNF